MDSGRNAKLMTQLGPSLSMALSPAFFLEQLTDLDEFFTVRVEDGEITEGQEFFKIHWTPFQVRIFSCSYQLMKFHHFELFFVFRNRSCSACIASKSELCLWMVWCCLVWVPWPLEFPLTTSSPVITARSLESHLQSCEMEETWIR